MESHGSFPACSCTPRDHLFCMMLGYSVANFAYSRYCVDFLRVSSVRDHLSETPFTASKTYSAFAYLDVYYVLVFRADRFAYCSDLSDELEQPELCPASCYTHPLLPLCPSYPQHVV